MCGGSSHHYMPTIRQLSAELHPPAGSSHIMHNHVSHALYAAVSEVGQCTSTQHTCKGWNEHTSPHTVVARLGSAPCLRRVSTMSVWPT